MQVLLLNWRDPKNPKSGGAEKLNLHICESLLKSGHQVTWYSQHVSGLPQKELFSGIQIIRFGHLLTHFLAWPFFLLIGKFDRPDLIIDCVHGFGYASNIIAPRIPRRVLVCEVAQNIWQEMWPFPISFLGQLSEKILFRLYGRSSFWAISPSTQTDLVNFGVPASQISVLPMGFDAPPLASRLRKFSHPTALFVGRLCHMKGVADAITAIHQLRYSGLDWRLKIIGRGDPDFETKLRQQVKSLGLSRHVEFNGFVSEQRKAQLMSRSWVLLVPSSREGWGMIVPEANFYGTPAFGYAVAGLREVLPYYSHSNQVVSPTSQALCLALTPIIKPVSAKILHSPGWNRLFQFVSQHV